jgi:hypothetical protein
MYLFRINSKLLIAPSVFLTRCTPCRTPSRSFYAPPLGEEENQECDW